MSPTAPATTPPAKKDEDGNLIRTSPTSGSMDDIIQHGIKTRNLLLSATPVNNDLRDLRNQLPFFISEGRDSAYTRSLRIASMATTTKNAQTGSLPTRQRKQAERDVRHLLEKLRRLVFKIP